MKNNLSKQELYNAIMQDVAKIVKKQINEHYNNPYNKSNKKINESYWDKSSGSIKASDICYALTRDDDFPIFKFPDGKEYILETYDSGHPDNGLGKHHQGLKFVEY